MRARLTILLFVIAWACPCEAQDFTPSETLSPAPAPTPAPTPAPAPAASSDVFLVAPLGGDAPEALSAEACDAVRATLIAEGFAVIDPADAATISPARFAGARRLDDLRPIATELGATGIATVAVWTSDGAASSVIVSIAPGDRSFSATEPVSTSLEESARDAVGAALDRQRDAMIVGGGSTRHHDTSERRADPPPPPAAGVIQNGQLFGVIGPAFLAAVGAAGIGGGIYASLDEMCDQRNPMTQVCVSGTRPNYALGVIFMGAGALALAGAIVWWILGSESEEISSGPRIDIVMLPGGGYLGTRGTF